MALVKSPKTLWSFDQAWFDSPRFLALFSAFLEQFEMRRKNICSVPFQLIHQQIRANKLSAGGRGAHFVLFF